MGKFSLPNRGDKRPADAQSAQPSTKVACIPKASEVIVEQGPRPQAPRQEPALRRQEPPPRRQETPPHRQDSRLLAAAWRVLAMRGIPREMGWWTTRRLLAILVMTSRWVR